MFKTIGFKVSAAIFVVVYKFHCDAGDFKFGL